MKEFSKIEKIALLVIIFLIGYFPFFKFIYQNSDGLFHLSRIESIYLNLKDGILLPNIQSGNMTTFGYLPDIFYPCLFYYIPALFRFIFPIHISLYIGFCIYKGLAIFLSYKYAPSFFKDIEKTKAFILMYFSNPIFVFLIMKQAYAEYIAVLFIPLVIFGLNKIKEENNVNLLVLAMSLILAIHLLSLYICTIICILYFLNLLINKKKKEALSIIKAGFITIIIGSYFLIPFIYYIKDGYKYKPSFNLINIDTNTDICLIVIAIIVLVAVITLMLKTKIDKYLIVTLILIYMRSPLFPIRVFEFLRIFQSRRRISPYIALFLIIFLVKKFKGKKILDLYTLTIFIIVIISIFFQTGKIVNSLDPTVKTFTKFSDSYYMRTNLEFLPDDLLTEYPYNNHIFEQVDEIIDELNNTKVDAIRTYRKNSKEIYISEKESGFLPKIYYPLYKITQEDNDNIKISRKDGLIYFENAIPNKEFRLSYKNSIIQYISLIISLIFLSSYIYTQKKKKP